MFIQQCGFNSTISKFIIISGYYFSFKKNNFSKINYIEEFYYIKYKEQKIFTFNYLKLDSMSTYFLFFPV